MIETTDAAGLTRRTLLASAVAGGAGLATTSLATSGFAAGVADAMTEHAANHAIEVVRQMTGKTATWSDRVRLTVPPHFTNGYTVPLALVVASPMTETDHVRRVLVLAPLNPIVTVAKFEFVPGRSEPRIATRIRVAKPQDVLAVAEMNDGALLLARAPIAVETNGCE